MKNIIIGLFAFPFLLQASEQRPGELLLREMKQETIFKIKNKVRQCPDYISIGEHSYRPEDAKPEDRFFSLNGYEIMMGELHRDTFTHENNNILWRPSVRPGKTETTHSDWKWVLGVARSSGDQLEKDGKLKVERSAHILSTHMIGKMKSTIVYDSKKREINYTFKANGIEDVICDYAVDSTVTDMYEAMKERELRDKLNSQDRSVRKDNPAVSDQKPKALKKKPKASQQ